MLHAYVGGLTVLHWINDALMAVFFLLVGLEIKREFHRRRACHMDAARAARLCGGWRHGRFPRCFTSRSIYAARKRCAAGRSRPPPTSPLRSAFWRCLGNRVPVSLKVFLAALAIIDDLGAVIIIALFYTAQLHLWALGGVAVVTAALIGLNLAGVKRLAFYLPLGIALWYFMHESGVHATLAGVVLALTIPTDQSDHSPLHRLEHGLHKWVAFLIVPLFGFANAGVSLTGVSLAQLAHPVTLGIAAGLFLGKQIGVFAATKLAVMSGITEPPRDASWAQVYGVSILCGVGFTMSLFIGLLAFPGDEVMADAVKIGVLLGSVASGLAGAGVLIWAGRNSPAPRS